MKMSNISFISIALFATFFFSCQPTDSKEEARPNIIFIMTDDHSYQTFSAYQDHLIETPHLDRIAEEGVLFTNSFVSNSICAPSRAVLLTGKHSHINGQIDNKVRFDSSQNTFVKELQGSGYQTAIIGKWHLKSQPMGFDHHEVLIGQGNYYNTDFIENGERIRSDGYVTDVITDKSLDWIKDRDDSKPFCLLLHHKATHRIWMPDTTLFQEFEGVDFPVPETFFDDYEGRQAAAEQEMSIATHMDLVWDNKMLDSAGVVETRLREPYEKRMYSRMDGAEKAAWDNYYDPIIDEFLAAGRTGDELSLWKYQRYMNDYLKCVRSVDNNVGRVLDYLDESGLAENTILVYTSDQGFYMGEHGWFDKRFMYEESFRTPLVMRWPAQIKAGGRIEELVQNIDHAPTLLDLLDLPVPSDMQGVSMKPLLFDQATVWREELYYHYYEYPGAHAVKKHYGIRTDRYKLIHFYDHIDEWEFYDLERDPNEMQNQINAVAYKDEIDDLRERLKALRIKYLVD